MFRSGKGMKGMKWGGESDKSEGWMRIGKGRRRREGKRGGIMGKEYE
jgi:hypothetical protein